MRESIPIAARLFMGWKVGNSHSAQPTILGYTLIKSGEDFVAGIVILSRKHVPCGQFRVQALRRSLNGGANVTECIRECNLPSAVRSDLQP